MKLRIGTLVRDVRRKGTAFEIDGREVPCRVTNQADGTIEIEAGAERLIAATSRADERVFVTSGSRSLDFAIERRQASSSASATSLGSLETPMPGRVVKIHVAVGDIVKRGQELLVVEAMKMENALIAPFDGVVRSLLVKTGDMVTPGKSLMELDEAK